ncbi:MAG: lactate utilization protein C [Alphaproteobacteria bacterium]
MSGGRDAILGSIRRSLGRGPLSGDAAAALEAKLAAPPRGIIPRRVQLDPAALVDLFESKAKGVNATVTRVASADGVPDAVADYLAHENLPASLRMAPDRGLDDIPWSKRPTLTITRGPSDGSHEVGLTGVFAAVAETGTLMLASGPDSPTTLNFLPDSHIVVLRASQVVGPYEAGWDRVRATYGSGSMPRTVNFVTGPSRTGDIEQKIYLGAHGPRRLHIIVIEDGEAAPPAPDGA